MDLYNKKSEVGAGGIPAIEFRNIFLNFEEKTVLTGLSFTLNPGEIYFVTSESGSGKSVLLKLVFTQIAEHYGESL